MRGPYDFRCPRCRYCRVCDLNESVILHPRDDGTVEVTKCFRLSRKRRKREGNVRRSELIRGHDSEHRNRDFFKQNRREFSIMAQTASDAMSDASRNTP